MAQWTGFVPFFILIGCFLWIVRVSRKGSRLDLNAEQIREKLLQAKTCEELKNSPFPRPVEISSKGKGMIFVMGIVTLLMSGVGGFSFVSLKAEHKKLASLMERGVSTSGHLTNPCQRRTGKGQHGYNCWYSFMVNGQSFARKADMRRQLASQEQLKVLYLAENPNTNRLADETPPAPIWTAFFLWIVAAILVGISWMNTRRQWNLLATGTPVPGLVTGIRRGKQTRIEFAFLDKFGSVRFGSSLFQRVSNFPEPGEFLTVVYDEKSPKVCEMYPMAFVKLRSTLASAQ